jgi:2'-5' RNA ligase
MGNDNWFFAFPLEGSFARPLHPPAGFRRLHPDDAHLTLAFLGACGQAAAERAQVALDEQLRQEPQGPLNVSLGPVVPMGPARAYSALSALLKRGRLPTERCIARLRDSLVDAAGARRDLRAPKPHVTIARPRRRASAAERALGLRWAKGLDLTQVEATLDCIALYTWRPDRGERLFQVVSERRLTEG